MKTIMDRNGNWVEYECVIKKLHKEAATHQVLIRLKVPINGVIYDCGPYFYPNDPYNCMRFLTGSLDIFKRIYENEIRKKGLI